MKKLKMLAGLLLLVLLGVGLVLFMVLAVQEEPVDEVVVVALSQEDQAKVTKPKLQANNAKPRRNVKVSVCGCVVCGRS